MPDNESTEIRSLGEDEEKIELDKITGGCQKIIGGSMKAAMPGTCDKCGEPSFLLYSKDGKNYCSNCFPG